MTPARWMALVAGTLLVGYSLWALYSGRILITWGQFAERPTVVYWLVVGALLLMGGVNLWWSTQSRIP